MNAIAPIRVAVHRVVNAARSALARPKPGRVAIPPDYMAVDDPLLGEFTPQRLAAILRAAAGGDVGEQASLFDTMLETDGHLRSVFSTRLMAVNGLDPELVPANEAARFAVLDEGRAKAARDHCNEILGGARGLDESIRHLSGATGYGVRAVECVYEGGTLAELVPVPGHLVRGDWKDPRRLRVITAENSQGEFLDEFSPGKFIVHAPMALGGLAARGALLRPAALNWLGKRWGKKWWAIYVELFGMPITVAKYGEVDDETTRAQLLKLIRNVGAGRGGVFPAGSEVELIQSALKGGETAHQALVAYIDADNTKLILGQTLTTQMDAAGGSFAAGQVHNELRKDIRDDDCRAEGETIRRDLLVPLTVMRFGPDAANLAPYWRRVIEEPRDLAAVGTVISTAVNELGAKIPKRVVEDELGLPLADDEDRDEALPGRAVAPDPFGFGGAGPTSGGAAERTVNRASIRLVANSAMDNIRRRGSTMARLIPWVITAALASQAHSEAAVARYDDALKQFDDYRNPPADARPGLAVPELPAEITGALASTILAAPRDDLHELVRQSLVASELAGRLSALDQARRRTVNSARVVNASARRVVNADIQFQKLPFVEAIDNFRDRIGMDPDAFLALDREARSRAWRVANVWDMDLLAVLHTRLARSMADGETVRDFRLRVLPSMLDQVGWTGENPWHANVVFYQNTAMATTAGRFRQYDDLDIGHWRFTNLGDSCPICAPHVGKIFSTRDTNRTPPLHFWCDCDAEPVFDHEIQPGEVARSDEIAAPALAEERARPAGFQWDARQFGQLEPIPLAKYPAAYHAAFRKMAQAKGLLVAA